MHAKIYINSQGSHDLKVIDYIQYKREKKGFIPLPIQEHLASEYLFFFFFFYFF